MALEDGDGARSDWFPWAQVSVDAVEAVARLAAMEVEAIWEQEGRWFGQLACAHQTVSNSSSIASA
jgi:hypothetical protein